MLTIAEFAFLAFIALIGWESYANSSNGFRQTWIYMYGYVSLKTKAFMPFSII